MNQNKSRTEKWLQALGLHLPSAITKFGSIKRIPNVEAEVNGNLLKSSRNQTETNNFKRWFGDWQNDPQNASKVVNADGTPKVVYHGTNAEFWTFDLGKSGSNYGDTSSGLFFFTNKKVDTRIVH